MSIVANIMGSASYVSEHPAQYLITYQGSGKIWDIQNDYADVTSSFIPTQTTSWAGSSERLKHAWQSNGHRSKHIGFGGWGQSSSIGGAIWDISNQYGNWDGYNNYDGTTYSFGGSGNAIAYMLVPHGNGGDFFYWLLGDTSSVGFGKITTAASVAVTTTPSMSNGGSALQVDVQAWGDYMAVIQQNGEFYIRHWDKSQTSQNVTNRASDTATITSSYGTSNTKISKSGNIIARSWRPNGSDGPIAIYKGKNISEYTGDLATYKTIINTDSLSGFTENSNQTEAIAVSDDDRWVLFSRRGASSPYYTIIACDLFNDNALTRLNMPTGAGSNARPRDIVIYPDSDTFFVSGYGNAQSVEGKISTGGYTKNFSSFGENALSKMSGSVGATILPEYWYNNLL